MPCPWSKPPFPHTRSFFQFRASIPKTMPPFPKTFYARPPPRRTSFLVFSCLFLSLSLFVFFFAFLRPLRDPPCPNRVPRSVKVLWDHRLSGDSNNAPVETRHKVMAFVGIQTGFRSVGRRQSLRNTWFPSDPHGLQGYFFFYWSLVSVYRCWGKWMIWAILLCNCYHWSALGKWDCFGVLINIHPFFKWFNYVLVSQILDPSFSRRIKICIF